MRCKFNFLHVFGKKKKKKKKTKQKKERRRKRKEKTKQTNKNIRFFHLAPVLRGAGNCEREERGFLTLTWYICLLGCYFAIFGKWDLHKK